MPATPTQQAHAELQAAFDRFNVELFDSMLPDCLITLQRKSKNCFGYYSATRFGQINGKATVDEIAMNPQHFRTQQPIEILQTLAHEMVHMWQHHFGKRKLRHSYHNKEWAAKMAGIGLMPSHTGKQGGKKTGRQMMDYPIEGGPFQTLVRAMIEDGFSPTYYDRNEPHMGPLTDFADVTSSPNGRRIKYRCPRCEAQVWGKANLAISCIPCHIAYQPVRRV
jgi:predicted SprT family Zn-dependent metalloprotease